MMQQDNTPMQVSIEQRISGHITLQVLDSAGEVVRELPEFRNLIVNAGLDNLMGGADDIQSMASRVKVGTGTGTPAASDTTLPGFLLGQTVTGTAGAFQATTAPYYYETTLTYLFPLGAINATLTCLGVHNSATGSSIFAWSQIKDSGNNPTTLTVLSTEQLSVTYKFRVYAPVFTTTGSITVAGDGAHDFTMFAHNFSTGAFGNAAGSVQINPDFMEAQGWTTMVDPVDIKGSPSYTGLSTVSMAATKGTYTAGTFTRTLTGFMGTTTNVTGSNIKGIVLRSNSTPIGPSYTMKLTTPIPKTNTKTLSLTFQYTIARYP